MDCARRQGTQFARLGLALSLWVAIPAQAATKFHFDLPAQPMIESLQSIVQTSGVPLRYAPEVVDGLTAPAVKASLDLEAAYSAVLAGSGLRPRFAADGAVVVAPDGAATQALVPVIELPPMFAPTPSLTMEPISRYDGNGPAWYWNTLTLGEHTGTHFDAPIHWITAS